MPPEPAAEAATPATTQDVKVALGPITADSGSFPQGVQSLSKGNEKYIRCVQEHGGLSKETATVDVRFLVRGRGRAEGSTAKKHSGLTAKAAQCIADVVDRRFVGYPPTEPMGATLRVTITKASSSK
jgi:hypothetical protein